MNPMLIIRDEQMRVFEAAQRAGFVQRMAARLAAACGGERDWIERNIAQGIAAARHFGLEGEPEVAEFIEITCRHLPDGVPALPPTRAHWPVPALAILCAYGMAPSVKIERYRHWAAAWDGEYA
jgi:hypothetical protein